MKIKWFSRVFAVVMVITMLMVSCLSTAALTITAPEVPEADDNMYAVSFEGGVLTIKVNPDKIYNMLRDGEITRAELIEFIPEDVLETLSQGRDISLDDLRELAANYVTIDDLKEIVKKLPTDVVRDYFSKGMLPDIFVLEEIKEIIPIDDMMAAVDAEAIKPLLSDKVIELLLDNENLKDAVTDEAYINDLIENTTLVDDLLAQEEIKEAIFDLVTDEVVEAIVDEYEAELLALAEDPDRVEAILELEGMMEKVQNYMTSDAHADEFESFINDEDVYNALVEMDAVKDFLFSADVIETLVTGDDPLIGKNIIQYVFDGQLDVLVTDSVVEHLLGDDAFVDEVLAAPGLLDGILTDDFMSKLAKAEYFDEMIDPHDVLDIINLDHTLAAYGKTVDDLFTDFIDLAHHAEIYDKYGMDVTAHEILHDPAGYITIDDILDKYTEITAHSLIEHDLIDSHDIRGLIGDDDKIKDIIKNIIDDENNANGQEVKEILKDSVKDDVDTYWELVDFKGLVAADVIDAGIIGDAFAADETLFDRLLEKVSPADIFNEIGMEECEDVVAENAEALIDVIGVDVVTEHYPNIVDDIMSDIGYTTLLDEEILTTEEVSDAIGGYSNLIKFFDTDDIIDAVGFSNIVEYVDVVELIESVGGYETVLGYYSTEEIREILAAMDRDALTSFIKNDLLAAVDVKELALDILEYVKNRVPEVKRFIKEFLRQSASLFLTEVDYISMNGTNLYELGMFDLNALINEVLSSIPDFETFIELDGEDVVASFDMAISIRGVEYKSGVAIGYLGDPTRLNNLLASKAHLFKVDVTDDNVIKVQSHTPDVLSDIYRKVIETDRLPAALRDKLVALPTLSIDDSLEFLRELPYDEIQAIVDALEGKLDPIKDKAYAKIDAAYDKITGVPAIDNRLPENIENKVDAAIQASKAKVDAIIDVFTSVDKFEAAVNKVANAIEARVPANLRGGDLIDLYNGAGNFTASADVTVDIYELISRVVKLPEEVKLFLKSTEISIGAAFDITVGGLYSAEIVGANGEAFEALLPGGLDFAAVDELAFFSGIGSGLMDENLDPIRYMPEGDVKLYSNDLYSVQFVAEGEVLSTVVYPYGTESIELPIIPVEYEKLGYTVAWEDFELNQTKRLVVELDYTAIEYTATFMADGVVVDTVTFTVEDDSIAEPDVPAKLGYTGVWEDYTLAAEDITINAIYTANEYTATFMADGVVVGTVTFTVEDDSIVEPLVPEKLGYTGAWEDYTLGAADITINAVYTAIEYTATFMADGNVVDTVTFTVEDTEIDEPDVPAKLGYTGVWEDYTLGAADITINAVYTAIEYTATFMADGNVVDTVTFTVEDTEIDEPDVPAKLGYTGAWEDYTLGAADITINAVYTTIDYTATFMADGQVVGTVTFTVEDTSITEPAVPAKAGYTGAWEDYTLGAADITINAVYTINEYTATFKADGQTVGTVKFTVDNIDAEGHLTGVTIPAVPAKVGYTGVWGDYTINAAAPADVTIEAVYDAIEYTATFVADGSVVGTVTFTVEDTEIDEPAVPAKAGYNGAWEDYELIADDITINAVYTAIEYTATFMADGEVVGTVKFTVEDTEIDEPAVPAKVGYTGAWEDYTLSAADITINAKYTAVVYTATFVADGKVVATVGFTVEDTSIAEPAVPAKAGYTGKWEAYELKAEDITINAIYTAIGDDPTDTDDDKGLIDKLVEEGTFWWWILLIIAILIIIAIILYIILKPKKDDDNGDDNPPAPPVVEEVVEEETPEVVVPVVEEVEDVTVEEADDLMTDDVAMSTVVYKEGGSTEGYKATVNLGVINDVFADGDRVDLDTLKAKGLAPAKAKRVKILASGHLNKHGLEVEANSFSVQAIKMITLTGGTVIIKK